MYPLFRTLLFRLDPETAHRLTLSLIRLAGQLPPVRAFLRRFFAAPSQPVQAFGLTFANPIGLAAGYDKDALSWRGLAALGFGHIEVGTVTPQPQVGNPRPRLFRLVEERAAINRMGFPGLGAEFVARQLRGSRDLYPPRPPGGRASGRASAASACLYPPGLVLGMNIGKNQDTPLEEAARDYLSLLQTFAPLADYLAINVSSPNTVGLRRLQARHALQELLSALAAQRRLEVERLGRPVPLLVKLAPDLSDPELDDALQAILDTGMDGVIATNTTLGREGLNRSQSERSRSLAAETGGLSGAPLRVLSTEMVRKIAARTQSARTEGRLPVIGVGGVASAQHVREKLDAGACLVQIYTGLIYEGPGLVKRILKDI